MSILGGTDQKVAVDNAAIASERKTEQCIESSPSCARGNGTPPDWQWRHSWLGLGIQALLVLVGVAGTGFVMWQISLIRESNDITQGQFDQMRRDERAWLTIKDVRVENFDFPSLLNGIPIRARFTIRNSGKTPATIIEDSVGIFLATEDAISEEISSRQVGKLNKLLAPDLEQGYWLKLRLDHHMTDPKIFSGKGSQRLWLAGDIKYLDAMGKKHITRCCYVFDFDSGGLIAYHRHNAME